MEATYLWARGWKDEATSLQDISSICHALNRTVVHDQAGPGIRTEQSKGQQPCRSSPWTRMTPYFYNYGHFAGLQSLRPEATRIGQMSEIGEGTVLEFPSAGR